MRVIRRSLVGVMALALLAGSSVGVEAQSEAVSRPPMPSAGCGSSEVVPGDTDDSMESAGLEREWLLHVPPAHDGETPLPLVIQLHGYGMRGSEMDGTRLEPFGDQMGFATVTPEGRGRIPRWVFELDDRGWDVVPSNPDVVFIGALIDRLGEELCLDLARVFATGVSNGAQAANALACTTGDRIAAIAPVAGIIDFGDRCSTGRPVPVIAFHGTADPLLLFDGGVGAVTETFPTDTGESFAELPSTQDPALTVPIPERAAGIARRYGCEPEPGATMIATAVERIEYSCPADADVMLILAHGAGHVWPGDTLTPSQEAFQGPGTIEIDAAEMMWEFFEQHPMPE